MEYVIVTGMSGAGKSTALKNMEDMGFFCVDNVPVPLLEHFVTFAAEGDKPFDRMALGVDVRSGGTLDHLGDMIRQFQMRGINMKLLFMDASDVVLLKRYKETRRSHPISGVKGRLEDGIGKERQRIEYLKESADYVVDTSRLLTRELNAALSDLFGKETAFDNLFLTIFSFGFKYGTPHDADLVFDVRFLPNPYYLAELRPKTGNDPEIREFVMRTGEADEFLDKLEDMLQFLIPKYVNEGKHSLVIALGCTGGKHRSVAMANEIYHRLCKEREYGIRVEHLDLDKDKKRGK